MHLQRRRIFAFALARNIDTNRKKIAPPLSVSRFFLRTRRAYFESVAINLTDLASILFILGAMRRRCGARHNCHLIKRRRERKAEALTLGDFTRAGNDVVHKCGWVCVKCRAKVRIRRACGFFSFFAFCGLIVEARIENCWYKVLFLVGGWVLYERKDNLAKIIGEIFF